MANMKYYKGLSTHVLVKPTASPIGVGPLPPIENIQMVANHRSDHGAMIQNVCKEMGQLCCVPLDAGYTINPDNYVYIVPTKGMDMTKLKIPKCRGIVIESGYEPARPAFRNHVEVKPQPVTCFRFEMVAQLRKLTGLPVIVRGVTSGIDAMASVGAGAAAVWVHSNFEGGASPISVLRNVCYTLRGNHMMTEVFFSGGIRRGTDVLKALALGANAVFLDPETPLWALYHSNEQGLHSMLDIINEELKLAMVLTHCLEVDQITEKQVIHMLQLNQVLLGKL